MHVIQIPHKSIDSGRKILGRILLSSTLVTGSANEYETKKIDSEALYWPSVIFKSLFRPATFAFPILVRSRKEMR